MKKFLKTIAIALGAVFLLLMIGIAFLSYEFNFKKVEISQSIEGVYTVTMYQVGEPGWPFGPVSGEFVLRREDEKINTYSFSVSNDGGGLTSGNAVFLWEDDCVKIRVCGEEQEDMLYTLGFDGTSYSEKAERILYMEVGQGADGDYYDEKGFCHGLYRSTDDGLNWEFVQNIPITRGGS